MDGVIDEVDVVEYAMKLGMKAVAITDHNGVQGFPHVFNMVTGYNKKLEEVTLGYSNNKIEKQNLTPKEIEELKALGYL